MTDSHCKRNGCDDTGRYRAPDHDSYRGRGDWADQCPECRTPPGCEHNAECPTGEDAWPLERVSPIDDVSQTGNGRDAGNICDEVRYPDEWHETGNRLHTHMRETFDRCLAISVAKNQDYASSDDPFKNFRRAEMAGVSVEQGILVRLTDKLCRIGNLLEHDAAVADERIGDTIDDSINYLAILRAWLELESA